MFDGEIILKKFPLKKKLGCRQFLTKTEYKTETYTESKTKLNLENFHQEIFFAKSLKMSCLMEKR